jgi:hypothetical protein
LVEPIWRYAFRLCLSVIVIGVEAYGCHGICEIRGVQAVHRLHIFHGVRGTVGIYGDYGIYRFSHHTLNQQAHVCFQARCMRGVVPDGFVESVKDECKVKSFVILLADGGS